MSLDCYPLGERRVITITEQPLAQDVVYDDDLLITVVDQCRTVVVFDLRSENSQDNKVASFNLGPGITIEQVVYCSTGDYMACICHEGDILSVNTVFGWRRRATPQVCKIDFNRLIPAGQRENLSSIDCCQKSGNLAIGCGETVLIYRYLPQDDTDYDKAAPEAAEDDSHHQEECTLSPEDRYFQHIISLKLTISVLKLCLLENYVSVTAADHVQVLKLELLPLQIQPDECLSTNQQASPGTHTASTSLSNPNSRYHRTSTDTNGNSTTNGTLSSILSDSNSAGTDYSLFNTTPPSSSNNNNNNTSSQANQNQRGGLDDDTSILTKNNQSAGGCGQVDGANRYGGGGGDSSEGTLYTSESVDGCITWNLNTKRLVKLPTLMHNSSTNLASYHICHPPELLGPASETIACRVSASLHSEDFCQNQLEAVVLLCRHFDNDSEPVKAAQLQAVYLANRDDQRRLDRASVSARGSQANRSNFRSWRHSTGGDQQGLQPHPLKSRHHELINSVTCFVSSLTNCYVYSLGGKRVQRTQTISLPATCVDLRPDLLNVHLLTTLGLQTCSSGICDSLFCYDWCSSADLSLSFTAVERSRCLSSASFIVLVSCSINGQCELEYMRKPSLSGLHDRIVETVDQCDSVSIRANLLTYLHASLQLRLLTDTNLKGGGVGWTVISSSGGSKAAASREDRQAAEAISILKTVTSLLCKQLLLKKQSNSMTNSRIDKAIIHLLDISLCDVSIVDLASH